MSKKNIAFVVIIILIVGAFPSGVIAGPKIKYYPGDRVQILGPGYWNPDCHGLLGTVWDFNNPTDYSITCNIKVPNSGFGYITPNSNGKYAGNGCYRVVLDSGEAGWYPVSSLQLWARYQRPKPALLPIITKR